MSIIYSIKRAQDKLIKKCKRGGIYENFGDKEIREIERIYIDCGDYTEAMNAKRELLSAFAEWCVNYSGE